MNNSFFERDHIAESPCSFVLKVKQARAICSTAIWRRLTSYNVHDSIVLGRNGPTLFTNLDCLASCSSFYLFSFFAFFFQAHTFQMRHSPGGAGATGALPPECRPNRVRCRFGKVCLGGVISLMYDDGVV